MKTNPLTIRKTLAGLAVGVLCVSVPTTFAVAQDSTAATSTPVVITPKDAPMQYGESEVVKLYQSGVSKGIIVNYIHSSSYPFHLNADEIIRLQKLGIPEEVTEAMLARDRQIQDQGAAMMMQQQAAAAQNAAMYPPPSTVAQPPVVTPASPAPEVTVIGSDYPYDYGYYPYYDSGWPIVVGGWGWGWGPHGWGWGWGRGGGFRGGFGGFHGGFHGGGFHGGFGGGGFHGGGGHR